jgi:hypothetical protein
VSRTKPNFRGKGCNCKGVVLAGSEDHTDVSTWQWQCKCSGKCHCYHKTVLLINAQNITDEEEKQRLKGNNHCILLL